MHFVVHYCLSINMLVCTAMLTKSDLVCFEDETAIGPLDAFLASGCCCIFHLFSLYIDQQSDFAP